MRAGICTLLLVGCGRVGFDARSDAASDDAAFPTGAWTGITEVSELGIAPLTDDPTLTADQLEIYFNAFADVYTATRASVTDPWSTPQRVIEVSTTDSENTPEVSADGLELFFSRTNPTNGDIFHSRRANRGDAWSTPTIVNELNTPLSDVGVALSPDGLTLYYSSAGPSGDLDIFVTTRSTRTSSWAVPAVVAELVNPDFDSDPFVTADGTVIMWATIRNGSSSYDLWRATRASTSDPFSDLSIMSDLSTSDDEDDPWMSPDRRTLYFTRGTNTTDLKIYRATR